jgi:hypothetical protein
MPVALAVSVLFSEDYDDQTVLESKIKLSLLVMLTAHRSSFPNSSRSLLCRQLTEVTFRIALVACYVDSSRKLLSE